MISSAVISFERTKRLSVVVVAAAMLSASAWGQTCTTQAKMTPELRSEIADSALFLALAVQSGDTAKIEAASVPDFRATFGTAAGVIPITKPLLAGSSLHVTQVYALDAKGRKAGETTDAEFSCPLSGGAGETDFSIGNLPPGMYAFAMVEATGGRPLLVAMLLRQEGLSWKLAGFYPRSRTAAGRDGLSYWTTARDEAKSGKTWLAWLSYGQADELLRPANFATSTNLDRLRSERRGAAPKELAEGIGNDTPLVLVAGADTFRFVGIASVGSDDGTHLNLLLRVRFDTALSDAAAKAWNLAAAKALLTAHKELRTGFDSVLIFGEPANQAGSVTLVKVADVP